MSGSPPSQPVGIVQFFPISPGIVIFSRAFIHLLSISSTVLSTFNHFLSKIAILLSNEFHPLFSIINRAALLSNYLSLSELAT
ncbi:hypothetical protein [Bacillus sp. Marseille-Q1617]|uniref:hypothetical protein n=1 Tax=Bacillus sp. Marseille-Q1617 TaxID=2736887 RepID=UPI001589977D|nr:hypothetical protein [Bacillus sp. Marseille-Q1617]